MSDKFEMINNYYKNGLWDVNRVFNVVLKAITKEEYKLITSFNYPNKQ